MQTKQQKASKSNQTKGRVSGAFVWLWLFIAVCIVAGVGFYNNAPFYPQQGVQPTSFYAPPQPLVNINTAPVEELMVLPGVGPSRAEDIVLYRQQNGPFASKEDLMQVKGIGEKTYNNLQEYICV